MCAHVWLRAHSNMRAYAYAHMVAYTCSTPTIRIHACTADRLAVVERKSNDALEYEQL